MCKASTYARNDFSNWNGAAMPKSFAAWSKSKGLSAGQKLRKSRSAERQRGKRVKGYYGPTMDPSFHWPQMAGMPHWRVFLHDLVTFHNFLKNTSGVIFAYHISRRAVFQKITGLGGFFGNLQLQFSRHISWPLNFWRNVLTPYKPSDRVVSCNWQRSFSREKRQESLSSRCDFPMQMT